ncbi:hypothetical protein SAMN05443665_10944 [Actinomadura meyerae]|uniref:Uncharacterized protein n=1 Tax=Actinomadura meyerae TaxID=240840 RepID=A0A239P833_9ACTN|nr:hypothetical protein SAMN05443665_10944 [Actinomadura meyerae]
MRDAQAEGVIDNIGPSTSLESPQSHTLLCQ